MRLKDLRTNSIRLSHIFIGICAVIITIAAAQLTLPIFFAISYSSQFNASVAATSTREVPQTLHLTTPEVVRAIYMSQCVVGTPGFRDSLLKFIENSDLNAVVIDIKDYSGGIGFPTSDPVLAPYVSKKCGASDMQKFIEELHAKSIYVIGRITVFQDPMYAEAHPELAVKTKEGGIWENYGGLAFVDVGARPFWSYIAELGKVAYEQEGFDELNFDYIRFPSDGPMADADYTFDMGKTKAQALQEFFRYLSEELKPTGAVLSADLFGYVTVHTDDLGIGQLLEGALPYFDYIDPMVYPSHYNSGFAGLKNVNSDPYRVVNLSLVNAVARTIATTTSVFALGERPIMKDILVPGTTETSTTTKEVESGLYEKAVYNEKKIRPWLQSFDYPVVYTPAMVEAQIQATHDAGLQSYLVWDAANKYTALRAVLSQTAQAQ